MSNKLLFHIGNLLILLSLIGFTYTLYPIARIYLFPQDTPPARFQKGTFLNIPKIHAFAPIIENVNPWNETEYDTALKRGVAHAKGTSLPGEKGTIFLFAHSSGMPWNITWSNTIFLRLGELQKGDYILIIKNGKQYKYKTKDKKEVWPNEVNYLLKTTSDQLILQTCTPIGTSLKRLLIFAVPEL